ncbi:hypothetical protein EVAR_96096_1 [Eumeta japonica]|uniref:Uncharacterized protein n=1 Tax=Eumeta variegata TaxID=151549 RepID=A0A4C1VE78_EUMVA|nr:hypothetical protein EVAR_96096_1 [Eumeta japonica]
MVDDGVRYLSILSNQYSILWIEIRSEKTHLSMLHVNARYRQASMIFFARSCRRCRAVPPPRTPLRAYPRRRGGRPLNQRPARSVRSSHRKINCA